MVHHRAFQPWLRDAKTLSQQTQIMTDVTFGSEIRKEDARVLCFTSSNRQVHSEGIQGQHAASFPIRVGGKMLVALFDTGATCSLMHADTARSLGLAIKACNDQPITGVGGSSSVIGVVRTSVKIGKSHTDHQFLILETPIAGYGILVGQDFMQRVGCAIRLTPTQCVLEIGTDPTHLIAKIRRSLSHSLEVNIDGNHEPITARYANVFQASRDSLDIISTRRDFKTVMKKIRKGRQVAYRVALIEPRSPPSPENPSVPRCIQQVINKHSKPGGVLSGDIPYGQTARGFEMHIDIDSGARPVNIRQYRLTPKERDALLSKTEEFIKRGWIEPSTSGWNSPVLFVPKPNGSLRFCVDYRLLNRVTHKDAHQTPLISEVLDGLQGAKVFTALDLCSGFYQIPLAKGTRPCTAFSTPSGLYQWCVMPMGLCNSPAVFQRAMNHFLCTHIKAGYCYVYLDDILIMSFSVEEHATHLNAVLTALAAAAQLWELGAPIPAIWARMGPDERAIRRMGS
jgi:hypothetical protein